MRQYSALPNRPLRPHTSFHQPCQALPAKVTAEDMAITVMTDFRKTTALTIDPDVSVDAAARVMRRRNVHLLLVVNVENEVMGIITSNDLLGEKTLQCVSARGISRADALVRDIMTPESRLEVISMDDVQHAHVGHVVATLKAKGRQHAAVVDEDASGHQTLRGLFSCSQLTRQLGEPVETIEIAQNFAEISAALKT
ncbi:MAG: CBS domain-containing protein [Burkholderiaceae bacterium]|nr:CBS domain-containing protein [Sulfuritalea sp.]MCF8175553.1 CBS domain-containing protein [Burkholderiaceae bacterium]